MTDDGIRRMIRRSHLTPLWSIAGAAVLGLAVGRIGGTALHAMSFVFLLLALAFGLLSVSGIRKMRRYWRNFEISLDEHGIEQKNDSGARRIERVITNVLETAGSGLAIRAGDERKSIWIPAGIDGYQEIRAKLADWAAIEQFTPPRRGWLPALHAHFVWVLFVYIGALFAQRPEVVLPAGALLTCYFGGIAARMLSLPAGKLRTLALALAFPAIAITVMGVKIFSVLR